ncbi:hypothetical protein PUV54_08440 [Hyphococcus flavus]|uniref:Lipoprotein n=1 Tax=Hyphococcus flavus TaxID=1866326 RepID=A0AAF0CHA8_9PROT|nr:hypothetical protein [Hyphococcus flavus]WDI33223.1 hypothetical protein PUV54_08440 [Hyphococcus flavus]
MKALKLTWIAAALALLGCGGPVPADMFLTLSVSTYGVSVETAINGKADTFLSGGENGSMTGSRPINRLVGEGENEVTFLLKPLAADEGEILGPAFLATLEISIKGETVDTQAPGERVIFSRELSEAQRAAISAGEAVTITENFTVEKAELQAIKDSAS